MMEFFRGKVTPKDWAAVAVILGVAAVIAALYIFVFHNKQLEQLAEIRGKDQAMQQQLRKAREISDKIGQLNDEVKKTQLLVKEFESRLPNRSDIRQLISKFEDLANQSELQVELVPGERIIDPSKETIPYKVTAFGNFHQIAGFINRLERYKRYLKVSNLKIEHQDLGVSKASFTLSTYVFREETPTKAKASAGAQS